MFALAAMMTAAAYFVTGIAEDGESFKRFVGYFGVIFFGAAGLVPLGMLLASPKCLELSDTGFQYSDWPDQYVNWTDLEDVHLGFLGTGITLRFKNKHHAISYKYRPRRPLLGKAPKEGELTISLLRFAEKERPKIQAAVFMKWSTVVAGPRIKAATDDFSEVLDQANEKIVEQIAAEEGLDPDELFDRLDGLMDGREAEAVDLVIGKKAGYREFEAFVRALHREHLAEPASVGEQKETGSGSASAENYQATAQNPVKREPVKREPANAQPIVQYGMRKR